MLCASGYNVCPLSFQLSPIFVAPLPFIIFLCPCIAIIYVTGFWKTNRNVTLGQLHFLGPANSHTHTLSICCCNTRLSCLICFSRADFADHVKPRLRQWDPWRALDGRYGSDIHPFVSETSHRPSRLVKAHD